MRGSRQDQLNRANGREMDFYRYIMANLLIEPYPTSFCSRLKFLSTPLYSYSPTARTATIYSALVTDLQKAIYMSTVFLVIIILHYTLHAAMNGIERPSLIERIANTLPSIQPNSRVNRGCKFILLSSRFTQKGLFSILLANIISSTLRRHAKSPVQADDLSVEVAVLQYMLHEECKLLQSPII